MTIGQVISLIKAFGGGSGGGGSSGGGVLVATVTWNENYTEAALSATYNQLLAAQFCVAREESSEDGYSRTGMPLISLYEEEGNYGALFYNYFNNRSIEFIANSPDGVMTHSQSSPSE